MDNARLGIIAKASYCGLRPGFIKLLRIVETRTPPSFRLAYHSDPFSPRVKLKCSPTGTLATVPYVSLRVISICKFSITRPVLGISSSGIVFLNMTADDQEDLHLPHLLKHPKQWLALVVVPLVEGSSITNPAQWTCAPLTIFPSHTKSRKGCDNCKKRHIRCDESFPQCRNCTKHKTRCPYNDITVQEARSNGPPDLLWTPEVHSNLEQWKTTGIFPFSGLDINPTPSPQLYTQEELRLIYHVASVSLQLGALEANGFTLWTSKIPT